MTSYEDILAAYSCYVKGFTHKFTYFMRTIPDISSLLQPLDDAVDDFIKVLFNNYDFNTTERNLWSLPVRMGGMGLMIPSKIADAQYSNSRKINEQLTAKVRNQQTIFEDIEPGVRKAKAEVKKLKETRNNELPAEITAEMGSSEKAIALEAIQEKGASSWLNTLPIKSQGYAMDKQSFRDAISTRYGIPLSKLPSHCVCGNPFSVDHALTCKKGGFVSSRHNEVRRITADLLKEVCNDVEEEPLLQEVTGERFKAKTAKIEKDARRPPPTTGILKVRQSSTKFDEFDKVRQSSTKFDEFDKIRPNDKVRQSSTKFDKVRQSLT